MPWKDDEYVKPWNLEYSDSWNMDSTIAMFMDDIITAQLEGGVHGFPANLSYDDPDNLPENWWTNEMMASRGNQGYEKWIATLTEIRDAFRDYANEIDFDDFTVNGVTDYKAANEAENAKAERVKNACALLGKWFPSLWD